MFKIQQLRSDKGDKMFVKWRDEKISPLLCKWIERKLYSMFLILIFQALNVTFSCFSLSVMTFSLKTMYIVYN